MSVHITTPVFEGPLDLLLQLITRRKVDITAVSLSDIVTDYLAVLEGMRALDLEITSEFLLIAATLIQMKTRQLLPGDEIDIDLELELKAERDRLLARLLACVTFKDVAAVLEARWREGVLYLPRRGGLDRDDIPPPPPPIIPVDPPGLAQIMTNILERTPPSVTMDHLDWEMPSVERAITSLRTRVRQNLTTTFTELVSDCTQTAEIVAYFLALLELVRWGVIGVSQDHWLADIRVQTNDIEEGSSLLESEWSR